MFYIKGLVRDIKIFNKMYGLPSNDNLSPLGPERISNFMNILKEEVREGKDLFESMNSYCNEDNKSITIEDAAALADWLGDIMIYCASEARRWGIPIDKTLEIIMQSNFSKLGEDGKPIYDERGKVLKGPNYWAPEIKLKEMLTKENKNKQKR